MNQVQLAENMAKFLSFKYQSNPNLDDVCWQDPTDKSRYYEAGDDFLLTDFIFSCDGFKAVQEKLMELKIAFSISWNPSTNKFLAEVKGNRNFNKDLLLAFYESVNDLVIEK